MIDLKIPSKGHQKVFIHSVFMNANRTTAAWKIFKLTDSMVTILENTVFNRPVGIVDLTVDGDIVVASKKYTLPVPYKLQTSKSHDIYAAFLVMPMLDKEFSGWDRFTGETSVVYQYRFDLSPEDVKAIKDVKLKVE